MSVNYKAGHEVGIPDYTMGALENYIEKRLPPGGFLTAVLEDRLSGAFGRADPSNLSALREIVRWIYMNAPGDCWGSPEKVDAWLEG